MNNFLDSGFNVSKEALAVGPTMSSVHVAAPLGNDDKKKKKLTYVDKSGTGVMIAWFPPEELAVKLISDDGEDASELHITLAYFGKTLPDDDIATIQKALANASEEYQALPGELCGLARFPATDSSDGKDVIVMLADVPYLESIREALLSTLTDLGVDAYRNHGYCPHMTLAYVDPGETTDVSEEVMKRIPITVDGLTLCVGGERTLYAFSGEQVFQKKMEDAPNYRVSEDPNRTCSQCVHGGDGYCDLHHF